MGDVHKWIYAIHKNLSTKYLPLDFAFKECGPEKWHINRKKLTRINIVLIERNKDMV